MNKLPCTVFAVIVAVILLELRCANQPLAAGSSEHGNARVVSGLVVDSLGRGASGSRVLLLPESFNPVADSSQTNAFSAVTDTNGHFRIGKVPQGAYCLNAVDPSAARRLLHRAVIVAATDMSTGTDTLRVAGAITLNASSSAVSESSFVYIPGTDLYARIGALGQVTLTAPQAVVSVNFAKRVTASSVLTGTVIENVAVPAGKDTAIAGKQIVLTAESDQWSAQHPEWLWCDDFETSQDLSANYADIAGNGMAIDSIDAYAGRYALCQRYSQGQVAAGWIIRVDSAGYPGHVFMRTCHKLEKGFTGQSMTMGGFRSRERSGTWTMNYSFELSVVSGEVHATMYGPKSAQANSAGYLFEDTTGFRATDSENVGRWVLFEIELQLNTPGMSDGACRVWIDDTLRIERTGVDVRGSDTSKINEAMLSAYFNSASPKAQNRYWDNFVISTQRIGPAKIIKFE